MAKQTLPTNFKDDILSSSMGGKRRYNLIQNSDGAYSLEDVTDYTQTGSDFGAGESDLPIADFYDITDFDLRKRGNEVFFNVSLSMQSGTQFDPNTLYSLGPSAMLEELKPSKVYFLNGFGCDSNWGNTTAISTFVDEEGYVRYCASVRKAYFKISGHWFVD